ncbi:alcohol dehydrogenase catalytic domain-containing protein [Acuticoccus kandeliae]|uniref:alcohol dehydrogenase catalytic domain-containing protein n=1 Tax=Acuticoccus kandeliae TaxID=2073160 RepID=UPI000D3EA60D|nr:alcohol dehydrogenase catalytic domain-containing protein [Acuticoccus kandeliae]
MKMTAAIMYEQGLPRPFAQSQPLKIERVDLEGPGPGEVLVEIAGAGLCHSDLSAIAGNRPRAMPAVVGHEAAGVVRETGPGVTRFSVGDHVVMLFVSSCGTCRECRSGRPNLCTSSWKSRAEGTLTSGARRISLNGKPINHYSGISAFAEYAVVAETSIIAIPKDVPLQDAAIFGCAVITGVGAVLNTVPRLAGTSVAVVGLGGVGLAGLLGAVREAPDVLIAVDLNPAKLDLAKEFGATHAFRADDPDILAKVKDLTGGGVDTVFEMAGSIRAMETAYALGRRGSTLVCVGLAPSGKVFAIDAAAMVGDERTIKGSYMGSAVPERDIPKIVEMYRDGSLPAARLRSHDVTFDGINAAFDALADGESVRQVLVCR